MRSRPTLPAGHGELLLQPPYAEWAALISANRAAAELQQFRVGAVEGGELRGLARAEVLEMARAYSSRLGVPVRALGAASDPIVMTGHQPEFYHAGVWAKDFLLQRLSDETGASAIDVVVDTDGFDHVGITAPCTMPTPQRCRQYLAVGHAESCFATAPVPSRDAVADFCRVGDAMLATLSAPSVRRHFAEFCDDLNYALVDAHSLAELVTFARRRYEVGAGTDYAELPVTTFARGRAFALFVADLALQAEGFARAYNAELGQYRAASGTRSSAQPFPDLRFEGDAVELPLWYVSGGRRRPLWAVRCSEGVELRTDGEPVSVLPAEHRAAAQALSALEGVVAPKALALTLFLRTFCCDLFIHGVGGGRYDRVTDGVCRRYYGIEPPAFVVASLTMYLPLGAHVVTEEEVASARERLHRLEHNPDALLREVDFDDAGERARATALSEEKAALVKAIGAQGADKKALGARIRVVNAELATLLAPLRTQFVDELDALENARAASEVLTDRNYPFCLWSPQEVADKVR